MKVVIITTGQPSVNPRVVKEADALSAAGIDVTVLYCFWIQWASDADDKLLRNVTWKYRLVGGSPQKNKLQYVVTRARFKTNVLLNRLLGNKWLLAERAQARCYDELLDQAVSIKADWYLAHNLGALSVAVKAAAIHGKQCGFDFEDYHRQENNDLATFVQARIRYLENKFVPRLSYISTASPLITERVEDDFPLYTKPRLTILNCFPLPAVSSSSVQADTNLLRLFWFSQTVGKNRGLETVILALKKLHNPAVHLILVGRADQAMTLFINEHAGEIRHCIHMAGIIEPASLPDFASRYDVGLASEVPEPLNRDICLTNKIFTYLVAGNCILASDTAAQRAFLRQHAGIGLLYKNNDVQDLARQIERLYADRSLLQRCKERSLQLAKDRMNWQEESKQLVKLLLTYEN